MKRLISFLLVLIIIIVCTVELSKSYTSGNILVIEVVDTLHDYIQICWNGFKKCVNNISNSIKNNQSENIESSIETTISDNTNKILPENYSIGG